MSKTEKVAELSIPNALKRLREMSGFTINEVGEIVGKSGKTVSAWENGRGQPDIETLITLSHLYNVNNILSVFETDNGHLKEDNMILSDHEIALIKAYRDKTNMQEAVDKLLDIIP